jgi:selenocysteine-specific elongation factor
VSRLQVVATAGHVDHGKSSLIVRLTGIDPDRWEEEKRRGLTIDLGFAWCTLPSGMEIGFVDVPGHERFIRNMLAGVGPVRVVLFVVAADEGWKPQSEEHLEILDVLGTTTGVVALTKVDLVDGPALDRRTEETRARLSGTGLEDAPIIPCSATSGLGLDDLLRALDETVAAAPAAAAAGRPRIDVDRSFTVRGAGTVVTGTLTGGELSTADEVVILPGGAVTRIRSLQTHKRTVEVARPVSRVAANLAGLSRRDAERGDVLVRPGRWRPTAHLDVRLRLVRSFDEPLTARGAYKVYLGSAERDARLRLYGTGRFEPGGEGYARLRLSRPLVAAFGDRFVLREAGRRRTVAGGRVLDAHPGAPLANEAALGRRDAATAGELPAIVVEEHGAIPARELGPLTGVEPASVTGARRVERWWIAERFHDALIAAATDLLEGHHRANPHVAGLDVAELRASLVPIAGALPRAEEVVDAILADLERAGAITREGTVLRLPDHAVSLGDREAEAADLVARIARAEPTPPTVPELVAGGAAPSVIDACVRTARLARVSKELVVTPAFLARAEELAREHAAAPDGLTVSGFREALGTTRKYALPLLASFDERGITRRDGDVRRPGGD